MIYKLSTNLVSIFSGTYETQWEVMEDSDTAGGVSEACYNHNELMQSIAGVYAEHAEMIKDELSIPWLKSIKFTGGTWSPREYNFTTDSLDFEVNIDMRAMYKYLEALEHNADFAQFLRDNYSSRDGFISYTPDNWGELIHEIKNKGREQTQAMGALITWAGTQSNPLNFEYMGNIEEGIHEDWLSNGYNGLDYWYECPECGERMEYSEELDGLECKKHPAK